MTTHSALYLTDVSSMFPLTVESQELSGRTEGIQTGRIRVTANLDSGEEELDQAL